MEKETWDQTDEDIKPVKKDYLLPVSILISAMVVAGAWLYTQTSESPPSKTNKASALEEKVMPTAGVVLPVSWGDLGQKLVIAGVIDGYKFKKIYEQRGAFTDEYKNLLLGKSDGKLKITKNNAGYLLNLFWALGLASKNPILESGEMVNPAYGGAQNFASTGGWTIAKGDPMVHYNNHMFFNLTAEEQALVDKISRGIYRPCCDNSTHFPDCNHGMAMLGLLELMASQGAGEADMWRAALAVNSYWFPDNYLTLATYMKHRGVEWKNIKPEEILGLNYSSGSGYARIASQVSESNDLHNSSGGCGIDAGQPIPVPTSQPGNCGI